MKGGVESQDWLCMQGIHLISHAVYRTLEQGGQFVLLGTGHADGDFRRMQEQDLKDHKDARVLLMYSDKLAHLIYAAADIVLVPSLFEPCGTFPLQLNQILPEAQNLLVKSACFPGHPSKTLAVHSLVPNLMNFEQYSTACSSQHNDAEYVW